MASPGATGQVQTEPYLRQSLRVFRYGLERCNEKWRTGQDETGNSYVIVIKTEIDQI